MMKYAGLVLAAGCQATIGTLDVTLTTAPGSHVLDDVETLKLVITNPHQVAMATRQNGKFAIEIDLDATGDSGALLVDGLDASGALVATGATPTFPIGALDAHIAVYMAAPNSIALAPLAIDPARSQLAVTPLSYGAVIAGGDVGNADPRHPSDAIAIYNAFDHTMTSGVAMPAPTESLAMATGASQYVYLYGGTDATGAPSSTFWRFDTSVAPAGAFTDLGTKTGFERAGEVAISIGNEHVLVTGGPPIELSGQDGSINARTDAPAAVLPAAGAAVVGSDGIGAAIFAGPNGVIRFRNNAFDMLAVPLPQSATIRVAALPGGKTLVLYEEAAFVVDVASGSFTTSTLPGIPPGGEVSATSRHVLIVDGNNAMATIYDATSLAAVATQPLAGTRSQPSLVALPNGQILIAGGIGADLASVGTLELFTPEPTE